MAGMNQYSLKYRIVSASHSLVWVWWKSFPKVAQMNYSPFPPAPVNSILHLKKLQTPKVMLLFLFFDYFTCPSWLSNQIVSLLRSRNGPTFCILSIVQARCQVLRKQDNAMLRLMVCGVSRPELKLWLWLQHLLAMWPWASCLTSLSLIALKVNWE